MRVLLYDHTDDWMEAATTTGVVVGVVVAVAVLVPLFVLALTTGDG